MEFYYVIQWEVRNHENIVERSSLDGVFTCKEDIVAELDRIEIAERQAYEQFNNTEVLRLHNAVLVIRPDGTVWYRIEPVELKKR